MSALPPMDLAKQIARADLAVRAADKALQAAVQAEQSSRYAKNEIMENGANQELLIDQARIYAQRAWDAAKEFKMYAEKVWGPIEF